MANPFLVLGGIAISVITAAFGVLAVPGWVASAQDASAINDVSIVADAQSAQLSSHGSAGPTVDALKATSGVSFSLAREGKVITSADPTGTHWLAVARSAAGSYFAKVAGTAAIGRGDSIEAAITDTGETITGPASVRTTSQGVPVPAAHTLADIVYANLHQNPNALTEEGFGRHWGTGGAGTTAIVSDRWTASAKAIRYTRTVDHGVGDVPGHFDIRPAAWIQPLKRYTMVMEYVGSGTYTTNGVLGGYPNARIPVASSPEETRIAGATPRRVWATFDMEDTIDPKWQAYIAADFLPGDWIELGNIDVYEGDYDPDRPWFSGEQTIPGLTVTWAGAPNASTSIAYR